jgi:integrase/recombinase XerD
MTRIGYPRRCRAWLPRPGRPLTRQSRQETLHPRRAPQSLPGLSPDHSRAAAGFGAARAAAGLSDGTFAADVLHLEQVRAWFGRPTRDMDPPDADAYFGKVLRDTAKGTRLSRAQALTAARVGRLFAGWREELATCRKFALAARNYARLPAPVGGRAAGERGLQARSARCQMGAGPVRQASSPSRQRRPRLLARERMVPLTSNAGQTLRWFAGDVWGQFGDDHTMSTATTPSSLPSCAGGRRQFRDPRSPMMTRTDHR